MINTICGYPHQLVMGVAAFIGAGAYAAYSIYKKKQEDSSVEIDWKRLADTTWQSILAGVTLGISTGCSYVGLVFAMIAGVGVDKIANKFKVKGKDILNFVQIIMGFVTKKK